MEDIIILGAIASIILFIVVVFLFRSFVQPLKLDSIKKKIDEKIMLQLLRI